MSKVVHRQEKKATILASRQIQHLIYLVPLPLMLTTSHTDIRIWRKIVECTNYPMIMKDGRLRRTLKATVVPHGHSRIARNNQSRLRRRGLRLIIHPQSKGRVYFFAYSLVKRTQVLSSRPPDCTAESTLHEGEHLATTSSVTSTSSPQTTLLNTTAGYPPPSCPPLANECLENALKTT